MCFFLLGLSLITSLCCMTRLTDSYLKKCSAIADSGVLMRKNYCNFINISIPSGEDADQNSGGGSGGSIWLNIDTLKLTGKYIRNNFLPVTFIVLFSLVEYFLT